MNSKTTNVSGGLGFFSVLAIVFIVLKLVGTIDWSWWWVLAPIWGPGAFLIAFLICTGVVVGFIAAILGVIKWLKKNK